MLCRGQSLEGLVARLLEMGVRWNIHKLAAKKEFKIHFIAFS